MGEKLPVFATVGEALTLLRDEGRRVLVAGLLMTVLTAFEQALILMAGLDGSNPHPRGVLYIFPLFLVVFIVNLPLITGAHRIVLQGHDGRTGWGFRREEWLYSLATLRAICPVLVAILIFTIVMLVAGIVAQMLIPVSGWLMLVFIGLVAVVGCAGIGFVSCRYMLVLPAAAIGNRLSLRRARELIAGNTWRLLFAIALATMLPTTLTRFGLQLLGGDLWIVGAALTGVIATVCAVLFAFVLSLTYRRLAISDRSPSTSLS